MNTADKTSKIVMEKYRSKFMANLMNKAPLNKSAEIFVKMYNARDKADK